MEKRPTLSALAACELAKTKGATTVSLTNVLYSTLAKTTNYVLPVCAGPEIAVASTKAYTAQVLILYMLSKQFENSLFDKNCNYLLNVKDFFMNFDLPNTSHIKDIAQKIKNAKNVFFIGRDFDSITSTEASLKLKEVCYLHCFDHPAAELKHGYIALVDETSYVFVTATQNNLVEKTLNSAHEAAARGAKIVWVSNINVANEKIKKFYKTITLDNLNQDLMPIVSVVWYQLLAYYTSISKGINPDKPKNLAKSVTVE